MPLEPSNKQHLFKKLPLADASEPLTAEAIASLEASFSDSLAPDNIAAIEAAKPPRQQVAPKSFLTAHMAIIDQILIDPSATFGKLSKLTGYSRAWIAKLHASDAFQAKLAKRQEALVDPIILESIEARLKGTVSLSLDIMNERLEAQPSLANALEVFAASSKAMGMGQKVNAPVVQNQFIVRLPEKQLNAHDWAAQHTIAPTADPLGTPAAAFEPSAATFEALEAPQEVAFTESDSCGAAAEAASSGVGASDK